MSNAKHTPGPWKFLKRGMIVTQDETKIIGTFHKATDNDCDDELLISAAPELLDALELAYEHINGGSGVKTGVEFRLMWEQIRATIAKARGE